MALWIDDPAKQKEIRDYFSSINCMTMKIIEDIMKVEDDYRESWKNFTVEEREEKINEAMVSPEVMKNYPLPEIEDLDVYPTVKIDTGQKMEELQSETDKNVVTSKWRDEHSAPFSLQTKSQMDIRIPTVDGKKQKKRKKKGKSKKSETNGGLLGSLNGSLFGSRSSKDSKPASKNGSIFDNLGLSSGNSKSSTESGANRYYKSGSEKESYDNPSIFDKKEVKLDWGSDFLSTKPRNGEINAPPVVDESKKSSRDLPDISFGGDFFKSHDSGKTNDDSTKKNGDVSKTETMSAKIETLPSSGLSKAYNESEFMDLYPQPKPASQVENLSTRPKENKQLESKIETKPKKKSPKHGVEKPAFTTIQDNVAPVVNLSKTRKSHRKKSSSGSVQVNPRSSLTLDGAIHNLEIAAEINRKQSITSDQVISHEKVFGDEEDLLKQIEKDTHLETWMPEPQPTQDSPLLTSSEKHKDKEIDLQKSGFDFLDNW
ncbi:uncharacterized protein LOC120340130 [Styela clava]